MTDQPKIALISLDLLEAYVALQRAVEKAVEKAVATDRYDSVSKFYYKAEPEFKAIAAASLAISKLNNNEQANK